MKSENTKPELQLQSALKANKISFETHCRDIPGTPDIAFRSQRIAIFVNGCFWHAHICRFTRQFLAKAGGWEKRQQLVKEKDLQLLEILKEDGWRPLIVWECQLKDNYNSEIKRVLNFVNQARNS